MASQAPNMLPLLYQGLEPLNRNQHGNFKVRRQTGLDRVASTHAIPVISSVASQLSPGTGSDIGAARREGGFA